MPSYDKKVFNEQWCTTVCEEEITLPVLNKDDRFVVLYTSGSTGIPKGVELVYSGIVNFCHWYVKEFNMTEDDRAMAYASFSFDAHMMDIYPALSCGASVYILPSELRLDVNLMNEYMERESITITFLTTQLGHLFASTVDNRSLRLLSVGGEKLMPLNKPRYKLYNAGGPTECTIYAFYYPIEEDYVTSIIGCPLNNVNIYVVDSDLNMLPQGIPGEMLIGGFCVGKGYLDRLELTSEKFILWKGERVYRTSDLVRWNDEGLLEYIGRIDNQVKLRGFRIELGEIESVCSKIAGVRQPVALVRNNALCLYYVGNVQESVIREELFKSLADYMVPSFFVRMETMPFTPNGKIDRKALPEPAISLKEYVAPETINEKMMCKIVAEELNIEQIGVTDSFKAYGMSSITTMKLNLRLRKCGYHLTMERIYKADCVKILCTCMNESIIDSEVGSWVLPFDTTKQIVVLCCGVIGSELLISKITAWTDIYNIYILQPIFSSWIDVEQISYKEILLRYFSLLTRNIKGNIYSMVGFSFGGELAYHLASMWFDYSGQQPTVLMGDTHIVRPEIECPDFHFLNHDDEYFYKLQREFFNHFERFPLTSYKGRTILISAIDNSLSNSANEQRWMEIKRDIIINRISDTHDGLYKKEEYFSYYLLLIKNS